jgi:F1F0 ATPase subunit 2
MSPISPAEIALYLLAGAALGGAYFFLLLRMVQACTAGAKMNLVVPLYLLRLAAAGAAFWFIAQQGAVPLLLALAGFVLARIAVQRWVGTA